VECHASHGNKGEKKEAFPPPLWEKAFFREDDILRSATELRVMPQRQVNSPNQKMSRVCGYIDEPADDRSHPCRSILVTMVHERQNPTAKGRVEGCLSNASDRARGFSTAGPSSFSAN